MTRLRYLAARVVAFLRRSAHDRDLARELDTHLSLLVDENVRRGMTLDAARRAARVRLGVPASLMEQHRAVRGLPALDSLLQDVRLAFRLIARDRWFSAAVIVVLALGIGTHAVGFTIVDAALLRALPFEDSGRLYTVSWQNVSGRRSNATYGEVEAFRSGAANAAELAAYVDASASLSGDRGFAREVRATAITANTFAVLRQRPFLGRDFTVADSRSSADPVVIIGYALWKSRYAAEPGVLGSTIRIDGQAATIVGVMPDRVRFPDNTDLWTAWQPGRLRPSANARTFRIFGRLRPGIDREQATAALTQEGQRIRTADPQATKALLGVRVETFSERYIGGSGRPLLIMALAAAILVLLIACANVANMLLSRAASREREMAVRLALGATRWRVCRQVLVESGVLALAGGALGLLFAAGGISVFARTMAASGLPSWVVFELDGRVVAYIGAVGVVSSLLCGIGPALHGATASHGAPTPGGGRGTFGSRRERSFGAAIVVVQLSLTVVLLSGAAVMLRSFLALYRVDVGVDTERLLTTRLQLPATKYTDAESRRAFFVNLEARLLARPGVEAVAVTTGVPSQDGGERLLQIEGASPAVPVFVSTVTIGPRFFATAGVPMVRGRDFDARDGAGGIAAVIVNEELAARFFPGQDPIGRRLRFTRRDAQSQDPPDAWRMIVGISGRILHGSSLDRYQNSVVYIPFQQESPAAASLLLRTPLPAGALLDAVRHEVQAIDPDQPVAPIETIAELMAADRWLYRTWAGTFGAFALIGLLLSAAGLYAVMAFAVTRRTPEIGLRMSLGALPRQAMWLVLQRGVVHIAIGLVAGLLAAFGVNRLFRFGLTDIGPNDPLTLAAIAVILAAVGITACLVPARRAARVDPAIAMRC